MKVNRFGALVLGSVFSFLSLPVLSQVKPDLQDDLTVDTRSNQEKGLNNVVVDVYAQYKTLKEDTPFFLQNDSFYIGIENKMPKEVDLRKLREAFTKNPPAKLSSLKKEVLNNVSPDHYTLLSKEGLLEPFLKMDANNMERISILPPDRVFSDFVRYIDNPFPRVEGYVVDELLRRSFQEFDPDIMIFYRPTLSDEKLKERISDSVFVLYDQIVNYHLYDQNIVQKTIHNMGKVAAHEAVLFVNHVLDHAVFTAGGGDTLKASKDVNLMSNLMHSIVMGDDGIYAGNASYKARKLSAVARLSAEMPVPESVSQVIASRYHEAYTSFNPVDALSDVWNDLDQQKRLDTTSYFMRQFAKALKLPFADSIHAMAVQGTQNDFLSKDTGLFQRPTGGAITIARWYTTGKSKENRLKGDLEKIFSTATSNGLVHAFVDEMGGVYNTLSSKQKAQMDTILSKAYKVYHQPQEKALSRKERSFLKSLFKETVFHKQPLSTQIEAAFFMKLSYLAAPQRNVDFRSSKTTGKPNEVSFEERDRFGIRSSNYMTTTGMLYHESTLHKNFSYQVTKKTNAKNSVAGPLNEHKKYPQGDQRPANQDRKGWKLRHRQR